MYAPQIEKREKKQVPWLKPGSPAHIALEEVVTEEIAERY